MGQYKYTTKSHGVKWSAKFRYLNPETGEMDIEYRRGFDTKREAKQYEDDYLEELKGLEKASPSPAKDSPPRRTFYQVYQEYLASHKHEDLKLSTLETKKNIFTKHIFPTFRNVRIDEITSDDIYHWQLAIKEAKSTQGKPFSEAYLRTIQCQLNSIINYANSKRLENGRYQWPRSTEEVREMTPQQYRWLMEGLTLEPKKVVKKVHPKSVI